MLQVALKYTTDQVIPPPFGSPVTVALNGCVPPDGTDALAGERVMTIPGTVMVAEASTPESVAEVAVSVTCRLPAGGAVGAVYVVASPLAVEAGETLPHAVCGHETLQLTPAFAASFATVAENGEVAPNCSVTEVRDNDTVTAGTVITTDADWVASLTDVANNVTVSPVLCEAGGV